MQPACRYLALMVANIKYMFHSHLTDGETHLKCLQRQKLSREGSTSEPVLVHAEVCCTSV